MIRGANADHGLASLKMAANHVEFRARRRGPPHEDDEQIGIWHRGQKSLEMSWLWLVSGDDFHLMSQRPQFLVRKSVEEGDRVIVVRILAGQADDVRGMNGRAGKSHYSNEKQDGLHCGLF